MKWKFTLPNSQELRKAIKDEDSDAILREIIKAYGWMESLFGEDNSFEIRRVRDDIECQAFDEDTVNMHLDEFWSACDNRRVWVEIC